MKIAIMTWYKYRNYGSKLQAFALKTILENKCNEVEFINYNPKGPIISKTGFNSSIKNISLKIKNKLFNQVFQNPLFDSFSN